MKTVSAKHSGFIKGRGYLRFVIGGVIFLVVLGCMGVVYQNLSMVRDRKLYPPPGQLVDVVGYRLHL